MKIFQLNSSIMFLPGWLLLRMIMLEKMPVFFILMILIRNCYPELKQKRFRTGKKLHIRLLLNIMSYLII